MTQLFIESVPSGAEVTFDGKVVGTTPLTHIIDEAVVLAEFRAECLSSVNVVCSWDVLKTRLEDQTVSRLWWDLTREERYSIAELAIKNTLFYDIRYSSSGMPNCGGDGGEWANAGCVHDSMVRYLKFVSIVPGSDSCYYKHYIDSQPTCYLPSVSYNLPGAYTSCVTYGPGYGHSMVAIQIDKDISLLDNWVVFQYSDFDIKPGHWQMPVYKWDNIFVRMVRTDEIVNSCNGTDGTEIIRWDF